MFPLDLSTAFIKPDFRYIDFCRKREVLPNDAIVSSFSKAKLQKSCFERSILQVLLDLLMDVDVPPLIETFSLMGSYEIDAIDIINESPSVLKQENVMSLMREANQKLRVVDINDSSFGKDFLRFIEIQNNVVDAAKLQRRRQERPALHGQTVDDEAVYYKVAGDRPKGCVYDLRSLWRKKRRYVDPDASTSQMLAE
ncbi:hypothetical protein Scep_021714 [Stephania cephalantha]|uniref:DWD hypersensitive to UV-B 1 N-terminal domain-containing protein n=1 Tax=Stephania cephalantha TaxID=152367 RepID=A0AAP0F6I6_9MAGN